MDQHRGLIRDQMSQTLSAQAFCILYPLYENEKISWIVIFLVEATQIKEYQPNSLIRKYLAV